MLKDIVRTVRAAAIGFANDACLSRGAALAYYTVFALAPVLVIVIATAGLVFGEAAAQGAIVERISGLMGKQGADIIQTMIAGVSNRRSGIVATTVGGVTLLVVASGVFGEIQSTLNVIWKVDAGWTWLRLVLVRLRGLVLVVLMGGLLLVSLLVSAALALAGTWLSGVLPDIDVPVHVLNFAVSFVLITAMFAAIYKVLPDTDIAWRDVGIGAAVTALLFTIGKNLISLYVSHSFIATSYGAAGTVAVVFVWVYYSCQIFLFGAELTYAYAQLRGSRAGESRPAGAAGHVADLRLQLEAHSARRRAR